MKHVDLLSLIARGIEDNPNVLEATPRQPKNCVNFAMIYVDIVDIDGDTHTLRIVTEAKE